jgi:hypothetical protein
MSVVCKVTFALACVAIGAGAAQEPTTPEIEEAEVIWGLLEQDIPETVHDDVLLLKEYRDNLKTLLAMKERTEAQQKLLDGYLAKERLKKVAEHAEVMLEVYKEDPTQCPRYRKADMIALVVIIRELKGLCEVVDRKQVPTMKAWEDAGGLVRRVTKEEEEKIAADLTRFRDLLMAKEWVKVTRECVDTHGKPPDNMWPEIYKVVIPNLEQAVREGEVELLESLLSNRSNWFLVRKDTVVLHSTERKEKGCPNVTSLARGEDGLWRVTGSGYILPQELKGVELRRKEQKEEPKKTP